MIQTPGFLWTVLFFLLAIGPLVFVHELGHYLVARWLGVKSEVFSIGFGREIFGWTDSRGTRWKVSMLPLGGYVRFAGDMNAASIPDHEWHTLPEEKKRVTFPAQKVWKRFLIVFAGPFANFLAAVAIFMGLTAVYGEMCTPPVVSAVKAGSVAERSGFKAGDRIVSIDGNSIERFSDIGRYVELRPRQLMTFELVRGGAETRILAAPDEDVLKDRFGNVIKRGLLGIYPVRDRPVKVPLAELPGSAVRQTISLLDSMVDGLGQIVMGQRSVKEMGGPLTIAKFSGQSAALGLAPFLLFMAMVSINLGFINLLPVPVLDGGHLFFYAIEAVIGRPLSAQAQEWAFRSGFMLLMALMLFVTFNDLAGFGLFGRLAG